MTTTINLDRLPPIAVQPQYVKYLIYRNLLNCFGDNGVALVAAAAAEGDVDAVVCIDVGGDDYKQSLNNRPFRILTAHLHMLLLLPPKQVCLALNNHYEWHTSFPYLCMHLDADDDVVDGDDDDDDDADSVAYAVVLILMMVKVGADGDLFGFGKDALVEFDGNRRHHCRNHKSHAWNYLLCMLNMHWLHLMQLQPLR